MTLPVLPGAEVRAGRVDPPGGPDRVGLTVLESHADGTVLVADPRRARLAVPGVARVAVDDGAVVTVDRDPGVADDVVAVWLHGPVVALLAGQQGRFALHATVVERAGERIAVAGRRGAGKSTTALAAVATGARLVADDVAVTSIGTGVGARVHPFRRPVRCTPDVAALVGLDLTGAAPVPTSPGKVQVRAPESVAAEPVDRLVLLEVGPATQPERVTLTGVDAVAAVRAATYRPDLIGRVWPREWFGWQVALAQTLVVQRIVRPAAAVADASGLAAVVDLVLDRASGTPDGSSSRR